MTGLLTPEHGVWELGTPLRSDLPTWAHVLRRAGYTTSISGRMHFIAHDKMHGFERRVYPDIREMNRMSQEFMISGFTKSGGIRVQRPAFRYVIYRQITSKLLKFLPTIFTLIQIKF